MKVKDQYVKSIEPFFSLKINVGKFYTQTHQKKGKNPKLGELEMEREC